MPKQEQLITLNGFDKETALAVCYQAFKELGWPVLFAGDEKILGETIKKWNSYAQQIVVGSNGIDLTISSEMNKGEAFDLGGKNKKNIAAFLTAFEAAKKSIQLETIEANKNALNELRSKTAIAVEQEEKEAEEVDKAMNLSNSNLYATYTIIGINVLVFILMIIDGAGIMDTNPLVHIKWGSNYTPLTLTGDWWRLISSTFIHFGIIHILMNMYCLYTIGIYLEPMLGKAKYITAYLCTGVLASLVSLWWHSDGVNSAGASGAVFGMYGLFLALLTTDLIPKKVRRSLLQSIGIFVVYNLVYGVKSGVDNAAHIGGLLSGLVFGYLYVISIKKEKGNAKAQWVLPVIIVITVASAAAYLNEKKEPAENRNVALNGLKMSGYKDSDKYIDDINEISVIEDKAIAPLNDTTLTNEALLSQINTISQPLWEQVEKKLEKMQQYDVSENMHKKTKKLKDYVELRKKELEIFIKMINNGNQEELLQELKINREEQSSTAGEIRKL